MFKTILITARAQGSARRPPSGLARNGHHVIATVQCSPAGHAAARESQGARTRQLAGGEARPVRFARRGFCQSWDIDVLGTMPAWERAARSSRSHSISFGPEL